MHFGTGPEEMETMSELDPYVIDDHLHEIEICSRVSKSIFFIVSYTIAYNVQCKRQNCCILSLSNVGIAG